MNKPNIFLIVLDSARADVVSELLDKGEMPGLQRFVDDGTHFQNAFTTGPWTLPSHASMFTGQRTSSHKTHSGSPSFEPNVPPLAELLREQGYETRGISGNVWISSEFGFDAGFDNLSMKWDRFWGGQSLSSISTADGLDRLKEISKVLFSPDVVTTSLNAIYAKTLANRDDYGAKLTTKRTRRWLRRRDDESPFFYFINYLEPHLPYDPPEEFARQYLSDDINYTGINQDPWDFLLGSEDLTESDFFVLKKLYKAELSYLDQYLSQLYETLNQTDDLDQTAVFIVGDHGENIGDHGLMDHQYSLHDTLLHVPLIARYPDAFTEDTVEDLVEVRDIYPTIASLAGSEIPDSVSQNDLSESPTRDEVIAEYRNPQPSREALEQKAPNITVDLDQYDQTLRAIRTDKWKLTESERGDVELRDLQSPNSQNIAGENPDVVEELQDLLDKKNIPVARSESEPVSISDDSQERLENLGYI